MTHTIPIRDTVSTGIAEFDAILGGGLRADRVYLLHGSPGSGKTTLSMQFLLEGVRRGESVLYVTLSETREELLDVAQSHGFSFDGIEIVELMTEEQNLDPDEQYTMYQPSEVELSVTTRKILDEVDRIKPSRVVIDSLSEIKLLAQSVLRFRRQVMALKQFFAGRACTALFLDDNTTIGDHDQQLESIAHGVISLEQLSPEYGAERRRLRVAKLRGQTYRGGYHDFTIATGGLRVFPRIVAADHAATRPQTVVKSGIAEMDTLLCGGIDSGTCSLFLGPAGSGKSTLSVQYACQAAEDGQTSIIFAFDERIDTILQRSDGTGSALRRHMAAGLIDIRAVDPAELSPGEFAHEVRRAAAGDGETGVKLVIIDSLNGYLNAMPEERFLVAQLHELLTYLGHLGVTSILVVAQYGLLGSGMSSPLDASYLSDNVILFRHFENEGEVRQLISVVKKRSGQHERTLREFAITGAGIRIGQPLRQFQGLLTGSPFRTDGA